VFGAANIQQRARDRHCARCLMCALVPVMRWRSVILHNGIVSKERHSGGLGGVFDVAFERLHD
jgi:hypothetical protein